MTEGDGRRRIALGLLPLAVLLATIALLAGPSSLVVCGEGHWFDRQAQSITKGLGAAVIGRPGSGIG